MELAGQRRRSTIAVAALGVTLMALAVALNVSWVVANWRSGLLLVFGVLCFALLIAGLGLNTLFLIREIRRNEQHDAFINAVTHELKTPVASIRLYLQTMQQREIERGKQQEFLETMLEDTDRLQSTIDQVLLAGKTGASRRPLNPADVDLVEMIEECVEVARKRHHLSAESVRVEDHLSKDEEAPVISGDPDELRAAVMNLLDNAIKYSADDVDVAVELARAGSRRVEIRVRDRGVGITRAELDRVFGRFYRIPGRSQARVKGTGLGLSIVLAVAKRHGGRTYVESEGEGKGSVFTLELPLKSA